RLIDVVHAEFLQNLCFCEMSDAALGHHWDVDRFHDLADHGNLRHASDSALGADLRGHTLQGHYGRSSSALCDLSLRRGGDVHNHAALQHFGKTGLQPQTIPVHVRHKHSPHAPLPPVAADWMEGNSNF